MKTIVTIVLLFISFATIVAQPAVVALEGKTMSPQDRFQLLKANSVSYSDYKIIHEKTLDGVWAILTDTLTRHDQLLHEASTKITHLQSEISFVRSELKTRENAMADIEFASTHMTVMGINFSKSGFLFTTFMIFLALSGTAVVLGVHAKSMVHFVNESKVMVKTTTDEFDDYKRKAMDKYLKISRELQTERNKLSEIRLQQNL